MSVDPVILLSLFSIGSLFLGCFDFGKHREKILFFLSLLFVMLLSWKTTLVLFGFIGMIYVLSRDWGRNSIKKQSFRFLMVFLFLFLLVRYLETGSSNWVLLVPGLSFSFFRLIDGVFYYTRNPKSKFDLVKETIFFAFPFTLLAGPVAERRQFFSNLSTEDTSLFDYKNLIRLLFAVFLKLIVVDKLLKVYALGRVDFNQNAFEFGLVAYAIAYFDLKAYSDIAIASSSFLGFKIPENLNRPWAARNLSDFWSRWHISVSSWCTQNIYFPFFTKTKSPYLSLFISMVFMGAWHGFKAGWIYWGCIHGLALCAVAYFSRTGVGSQIRKSDSKIVNLLSWILTQAFVVFTYAVTWFWNTQ